MLDDLSLKGTKGLLVSLTAGADINPFEIQGALSVVQKDVGEECEVIFGIFQDEDILSLMNEWNVKQHTSSGLVEKIKSSDVSIKEAEEQCLKFFQSHIKQHKSPLCGSSVSHDRRFLIKHMSKLANHFHYRHIDVSSFKEVIKRWYPEADEFKKASSHRAMDDIKESVNELKFYRDKLFIKND